jgi:hypothetical protein
VVLDASTRAGTAGYGCGGLLGGLVPELGPRPLWKPVHLQELASSTLLCLPGFRSTGRCEGRCNLFLRRASPRRQGVSVHGSLRRSLQRNSRDNYARNYASFSSRVAAKVAATAWAEPSAAGRGTLRAVLVWGLMVSVKGSCQFLANPCGNMGKMGYQCRDVRRLWSRRWEVV